MSEPITPAAQALAASATASTSAALAKTETAKPRPRIVAEPRTARFPTCAWRAYCPEMPEIEAQFGATEAEAMAKMEAALAKTEGKP